MSMDKIREAFNQAKHYGIMNDGSIAMWEDLLALCKNEVERKKKQIATILDQANRIKGQIDNIKFIETLVLEVINKHIASEIKNQNYEEIKNDPNKLAEWGKENQRPIEPLEEITPENIDENQMSLIDKVTNDIDQNQPEEEIVFPNDIDPTNIKIKENTDIDTAEVEMPINEDNDDKKRRRRKQ